MTVVFILYQAGAIQRVRTGSEGLQNHGQRFETSQTHRPAQCLVRWSFRLTEAAHSLFAEHVCPCSCMPLLQVHAGEMLIKTHTVATAIKGSRAHKGPSLHPVPLGQVALKDNLNRGFPEREHLRIKLNSFEN